MCELASLALTAVSTAVGMFSQFEQGRQAASAAKSQAAYNAQLLENEQAASRTQAQNALARTEAEADRQRRQAARVQGEAASMMAASGFEMDSGSALSLLAEGAQEAQYDNNIIRNNGANEAYQYQSRAIAQGDERLSVLAQGANAAAGAKNSAMWGMGTTLLSGLGQGLNQYKGYQNTQAAQKKGPSGKIQSF